MGHDEGLEAGREPGQSPQGRLLARALALGMCTVGAPVESKAPAGGEWNGELATMQGCCMFGGLNRPLISPVAAWAGPISATLGKSLGRKWCDQSRSPADKQHYRFAPPS